MSNGTKVKKRDGRIESLDLDKMHLMVAEATRGADVTSGTSYETGVGWVGVTTYNDNEGTLRVKKEILVAMSGITTGNAPVYGNPPV